MTKILFSLAASAAFFVAGAAHAQGMPPSGPGIPAPDPMRGPGATPQGMEAHDNVTNTAIDDRIHKGIRDKNEKLTAKAVPATPADIAPGSQVRDSKGKMVGTIETVDADGAVLSTGVTRVKVPLDAFGKNKKGLMLGITKAEFEAAAASAT